MLASGLFGLISLAWLAWGVALAGLPTSTARWIRRTVRDPLPRFLLAQGLMLAGLLLLLGTGATGMRWLWMSIGGVMVVKGMLWLGAPEAFRARLLNQFDHLPPWSRRVVGVIMMGLATLLATETIRGPITW
jgi:threonine/homoserine/homoserine lactone efflux protein